MQKPIIYLVAVIAILSLGVTSSYAKKYSAAPSGQGVSTIGIGGDYASLFDASTDFVATPNTGNWTMQVLSNLTETTPATFGHYVPSSNTIILMPAPTVSPTIVFAETLDNNGPSGFLLIGPADFVSSPYNIYSTNNFIIDGSNNGTNSRNMTFVSTTAYNQNNMFIRCCGPCNNFTIKNCIVNCVSPNAAAGGALEDFAIRLDARATNNGSYSGTQGASGVKILNNYILSTCDGGTLNAGIYISSSGQTLGSTTVTSNITISGNYIVAQSRAIYMLYCQGGTISNNTIQILQPSSVGLSLGIYHSSGNSVPGNLDIYNNVINQLSSGAIAAGFGIGGIELDATLMSYNVYNNMISGYAFSGNSTALTGLYYEGISGSGATTNYNIYNNSVDMTNITNVSSSTCISINMAGTFGNYSIVNNIIRNGQSGGVIYNLATTSEVVYVNNNDLYPDNTAGAIIGQIAGLSPYTTLAAWQSGTGKDAGSQSVDPFVTAPSSWVSHSNLHFNSSNIPLSGDPNPSVGAAPLTAGTPLTLVSTDIDGETRSGSTPWKGADELYTLPYATPNSLFARPGNIQQFVAAGGVGPYTWALSTSAIGNLDTASGSTVNFTAANITLSATLTLTDSSVPAKTFVVNIQVTPTNAPMVNDITLVPASHKDIARFDFFRD